MYSFVKNLHESCLNINYQRKYIKKNELNLNRFLEKSKKK